MKAIWEKAVKQKEVANGIAKGDYLSLRPLFQRKEFDVNAEGVSAVTKWLEKNSDAGLEGYKTLFREIVLQDALNKSVSKGHAPAFEDFFDAVLVRNASLKSATGRLSETIGSQNAYRGLKSIALLTPKYGVVAEKLSTGKRRNTALAFSSATQVTFTSRSAFKQLTGRFPT
ncbi:hypothetical protein AUJ14_04910 [Candidatus Micrarchaeota archaeon CG1_02_55_22]|nr:MAG: hypothetical protein AUJ14_04910 [Candidatus Micrarchaeota archaeon CG1_02_55_22]